MAFSKMTLGDVDRRARVETQNHEKKQNQLPIPHPSKERIREGNCSREGLIDGWVSRPSVIQVCLFFRCRQFFYPERMLISLALFFPRRNKKGRLPTQLELSPIRSLDEEPLRRPRVT